MEIEKNSALLVIDIQQEDFVEMPDDVREAAKDGTALSLVRIWRFC